MDLLAGRAVLSAPQTGKEEHWLGDGAHGVTRPACFRCAISESSKRTMKITLMILILAAICLRTGAADLS